MKAFLIDPFDRNITEIDFEGNYKKIQELVECDVFTIARPSHDLDVYVDDEGLINGKDQSFFLIDGYPDLLAGKALVLGHTHDGDSAPAPVTLRQLQDSVTWALPIRVNGQIVWLPL